MDDFEILRVMLTFSVIVFVPIWLVTRSLKMTCIMTLVITTMTYVCFFTEPVKQEKNVTWNDNVEVFEID